MSDFGSLPIWNDNGRCNPFRNGTYLVMKKCQKWVMEGHGKSWKVIEFSSQISVEPCDSDSVDIGSDINQVSWGWWFINLTMGCSLNPRLAIQ